MLKNIEIPDGQLYFAAEFLSALESRDLYAHLMYQIEWQQEEIKMFGKKVLQPRLHAWYGDPDISYTYSGLTMKSKDWTPQLNRIKDKIQEAYPEAQYNSVLLNLYRDGKDSMGWHSDDEPELGINPTIASLSLGGSRRFHLKHKKRKEYEPLRLDLQDGSLLLMAGSTQHFWKHQISKTAKAVQPRINLTFRYIQS